MLTCLRIRQLAIVSEVEVGFGPGLNVVTGETGAGKSILVHALQLLLGARARPDAVRTGAEQAEIEGLFEIGDEPLVRARLQALGLQPEDELVIRRVVQASGRSRAYVNGSLATAAQLASLASGLIDISSQHEHHTLADPITHLGWLDAFGGLASLVQAIGSAHETLSAVLIELQSARDRARDRAAREDLLRFQLAEIERVNPTEGEEARLLDEIGRLRHADLLARASAGAEETLFGGEDAVCDRLGRVGAALEEAARVDSSLEPLLERLDGARVELEDIAHELGRYARAVDGDPGRLAEAEERVHQLKRLARRHGGTVESVMAHRESLARELAGLDSLDAEIGSLERRLEGVRGEACAVARQLSLARRAAAEGLGSAITSELASLGMGGARVLVDVAALDGAAPAELSVDGARLGPTGVDRVEFLIAPNRGEEPRPLRRVASGGELSRALLALKRVLAGIGPVGTYVFDEVDTGVGGAVAETIGLKLREVGQHHQVLCITHLPQVAALGDVHLVVSKGEAGGRTHSAIRRLGAEERVEELARMLGGLRITETTRRAAKELLVAP